MIKSDSLLGVIIISCLGWYLSGISHHQGTKVHIRQTIEGQYNDMRNNLLGDIDTCLTENKLSKDDYQKRYKSRADLVTSINEFRDFIPVGEYLKILKLTRFDYSEQAYSLCSFSKSDLKSLRDKLAIPKVEF